MRRTIQERFDNKIDKQSNCWLWTAYTGDDGYGQLRVSRRTRSAHHVAWWLRYGEWPILLRHTCDTPACVNPDHLVEGTHELNVQDRVERGRSAKGDGHGRSKLTEAVVKEIRKSDQTSASLARQYGVDRKAVERARKRVTWKHVQ